MSGANLNVLDNEREYDKTLILAETEPWRDHCFFFSLSLNGWIVADTAVTNWDLEVCMPSVLFVLPIAVHAYTTSLKMCTPLDNGKGHFILLVHLKASLTIK